jgi:small subunit ribosomal protein S11
MSKTTEKINTSKTKKKRKSVTLGVVYILATFNNTRITLTDIQGNVLEVSSAGMGGFKGPKKSTPYAASVISSKVFLDLDKKYGLKTVDSIKMKGAGSQREHALRSVLSELQKYKITVSKIQDCSPIPHNGVRPPKRRRT